MTLHTTTLPAPHSICGKQRERRRKGGRERGIEGEGERGREGGGEREREGGRGRGRGRERERERERDQQFKLLVAFCKPLKSRKALI